MSLRPETANTAAGMSSRPDTATTVVNPTRPPTASTPPMSTQKEEDIQDDNDSKKDRNATPPRSVADSEATLARKPYDFDKTIKGIVQRQDDAGVQRRELGVVFENLRVVGLGASAIQQQTIGSIFNPLNKIDAIRAARHPPLRDILSGFEGVVRPGEMLLVLGRPGSGCTTLLKTLSNQHTSFHSIEGSLAYSTLSPETINKHYRGDVQYTPEDDVHFPTLTVQQTLEFAATSRAPQNRVIGGEDEEQGKKGKGKRTAYAKEVAEMWMKVFGLSHVSKTVVGDAAIRGVSGGEKKRVSLSEALASRSVVHAWDNSTRGLDSSTALEFLTTLRTLTTTTRLTTLVSLYQAGAPLYALFDKVCLLYEGRMVYYGPASSACEYFEEMGWVRRNRQTIPDFLVGVTDAGARVWRGDREARGRGEEDGAEEVEWERGEREKGEAWAGKPPPPRTPDEFATYFTNSELGRRNKEDIASFRASVSSSSDNTNNSAAPGSFDASQYRASAMAEHARHVRGESAYVISVPMQVRAVMRRRVQILRGGWGAQVIQTVSFALNAIILGTTFLKVPKNTGAYFSRGGIIFFSLFLPALFTMAEIPALFAQRPIVLRHQQAALYHPFAEALAMTLVDIPMTFVTIGVFSTVLYFLVDLQRTAAQFFTFFLFIFTLAMAMKTFFRMLAAAFGSEAPAQAVAGVLLLATALYTGYQIQIDAMVWPLRAISYINPLRYGFESLMVNEFHTLNGQCSTLVPSGPGYAGVSTANQVCTTVGSQAGQAAVSGTRFVEISFGYQLSHLWRNYAIDAAFAIFFLLALLVFTEYNTRSAGEKSSALLFKPGSRATALQEASAAVGADEEKAEMGRQREQNLANRDAKAQEEKVQAEKAMEAQPTMENVFSWQHIEYEISANGERKRLLDDVSGYVAPGKLTALMGESGAGKTTLLNVLAERVDTGVVHGDRFVNGQALPPDFQAQTGYCQQTDTHVPTTTVREALLFSAKMRQPQSVPIAEKEAYVEQCLKMCGLEEFADAMVGSLGVEHRKRTTIGVELAAKPKLLLFLDEPTSGLDSQSAWAILAFLRELAEHGQAILCTIHQPSAELFQVFDRLLLLKKGGQTVYFGDLGHNAETIINYFEAHGSRRCKPGENPAEFMLDVIGAGATASTDRDWHGIWLDSKEAGELQNTIENIHTEGRKNPAIGAELEKTFATSWFYQTGTLLARGHVSYWRDPTYLMSKLALNIIGGLFIGFTFFKSKDTLQGSQQKVFAIFMATIMSAPLSGQLHVPFINLRNVYEIRERSSRMYSWSALITSQILTEVPWNMFGSSLFFVCWYWTVGFATSRAGYAYLMYGVLFPMYFSTVALAVAAFSPTAEIAGLLFNFLFSFVLTFDGVVEPYAQLTFWKFAYRVSPYTYLIEGLIGHTLGGKQINCAEREFVTLEPPSGSTCGSFLQQFISNRGGYLENPSASSNCQFCSSRTTDQYFGPTFNIFYNHAWRDTGLFCGYIVFNTFLVFLFTYLFRVRSRSIIRLFKRSRKA